MTTRASGVDEQLAAATTAVREGGVVMLIDEVAGTGDLILAAQMATAQNVNFLAKHGRGLTALALSAARVQALGLPPMVARWDQPSKPFTISIEARSGIGTGISAADRALTIRVAVSPGSRPGDLVSPGHVFPLRAHADGLAGHRSRTEAALALVQLAGLDEGAVLTEVLDETGELAGPAVLRMTASRLRLPSLTIARIWQEHNTVPPGAIDRLEEVIHVSHRHSLR